ncbi:uncharacterized protein LOC126367429 [Pectinophora gossypiella]|uniref:uncharacterized protein LOC126367429 n=1 Tax=Pectinophora gossypiella TaxID=13191 RepID=UPI00214E6AD6|nr:uncharacterized protein LOC126367429 [Pectinophora gossypiella]
MEGLHEAQIDNYIQIDKLYTNYKKTSKEKLTKPYIEARYEILETYWKDFQTRHSTLLSIKASERKEFEYFSKHCYDTCMEIYLDMKTRMKEKLMELDGVKNRPASIIESSDQSQCKQPVVSTKLPAVQLPTFSGDYKSWLSFRDLYESLVHNNPNISKVNKCQYLKTSLQGEAENLVKQIQVSEANYDTIWDMLTKRYDNKRSIVNAYIEKLLNQKRVTTLSSKAIRELLDTTTECLATLKSLKLPTDNWDDLIVYIVIQKLDPESHKLFEQRIESTDTLPTWNDLSKFLELRFRTLEAVKYKESSQVKHATSISTKSFATGITDNVKCVFCKGEHFIFKCKDFQQLDINERKDFIQKNMLCFNCLRRGHSAYKCLQSTTCKKCGRRHHSLIHGYITTKEPLQSEHTESQEVNVQTTTAIHTGNSSGECAIVLATALVNVRSQRKDNEYTTLRALVDQGSQACLITEAACQHLGFKRVPIYGNVTGVGSSKSTTKAKVEFDITSKYNPHISHRVNAYVLSTLTSCLPQKTQSVEWPEIADLELADPTFCKPGKIDLILGADIYAEILQHGMLSLREDTQTLIAQRTTLGWLISGKSKSNEILRNKILRNEIQKNKVQRNEAQRNEAQRDEAQRNEAQGEEAQRNEVQGNEIHTEIHIHHTRVEMDTLLKSFWEIEEKTETPIQTNEEKRCEKFYEETHKRLEDGRYRVQLPFVTYPPDLGESLTLATQRLNYLERKFKSKPELKERYDQFMHDYLQQKHMEVIEEEEEIQKDKVCYLPHHAVVNEQHLTTKLRVVFDSSAKTSNGKSLNENLMIGPALQNDIRDVTLKWRKHQVVLIGDIRQMYRQIQVHPRDTDYQRILYRFHDKIQHFRLTTVTYGTSCAPYLAIKTLKQIAEDERPNFKEEVIETALNDFYIDDLLTGHSTEESVKILKQDLVLLLQKGGFLLHKWASNSPNIEGAEQTTRKILGINWNGHTDKFELQITLPPVSNQVTKRTVLCDIAKIYDPAGWLAPVVVVAKSMLQKLWLNKLDWDDQLTETLRDEWFRYREELEKMPTIELPRWIGITDDVERIELHGFSDASTIAYSAVVYCRVITPTAILVTMLEARTRVAPVKQVSLPRLELCGAVLLAKLLHRIQSALTIPNQDVYAWTDATIVLAWLQRTPSCWTTFVANRVTEIINVVEKERWHHVTSQDNPADVASRGISPTELPDHILWWRGPGWLNERDALPTRRSDVEIEPTEEEMKVKVHVSVKLMCCAADVLEGKGTVQVAITVTELLRRHNSRTSPPHAAPAPVAAAHAT